MSDIYFKPWIGKYYGQEDSVFKKRVLVLGDSHYIDESDMKSASEANDFTTGVMLDYLDENISGSWKSTFSKFMNSFVQGTANEDCKAADLWNSVSFYNFLQVAAGEKARETQNYDYMESKHSNALTEVIEQLSPDFIISWGNKVWDAIPENLRYGKCRVSEKFDNCCYIYPFKDKEIKLIGITHPSTSYKSSYWATVFSELEANV